MDLMTARAVSEVLDSLSLPSDEPVFILSTGYNEGNDFVADAFARELARRGFQVRKAQEVEAAPSGQVSAPPTGGRQAPPPTPREQVEQEETIASEDLLESEEESEDPFAAEETPVDPFAPDTTESEADDDSLFWPEPDTTDVADSLAQGVLPDGTSPADSAQTGSPDTGVSDALGSPRTEPIETPPAGPSYPEGTILEFRVLEFGISYPQVKRRFFVFGTSAVRRVAGVYLQASHIVGPDGDILDVASGQSHREDFLKGSARALAEGASYPFTQPEVVPTRAGKLVEPIVVTGIIASLVYLFYQNQN
jgi:hypothetical protein